MIGLDTNIIVRYLTQDDQKQAKIANEFFTDAKRKNQKLWINKIVMCELVWVLEEAYRYPKKEIIKTLTLLLQTSQIDLEMKENMWEALRDYENSNADFSDCLIGRQNIYNGCEYTISFDKQTHHLKTFKKII